MKNGDNIMVHAHCSKEKELSKIHENIALIQKDISYIRESFDKEIKIMSKTIYGNGKPGLIQNVQDNTDYKIGQEAQLNLIRWIAGSSIFMSVISFVVTVIMR